MKKSLSIFLAIILVLLQIPVNALAESEVIETNLIISSTNTFHVDAGNKLTINLDIKNIGTLSAKQVVGILSNDDTEMLYVTNTPYSEVGSIHEGKTKTLSFEIMVDESADSRIYTLPLKINYNESDYRDDAGNSIPAQPKVLNTEIIVRVSNKTSDAKLVVDRVDVTPSNVVAAGENIKVGLNIRNLGLNLANDIKVSLKGLGNDSFILSNGVNYKTISSINKGSSSTVYFDLKSSKNLPTGSYPLSVEISYKNHKNELLTDTGEFFITVGTNSNQSANVIMENLTYPLGSIGENTEVPISFTLKNLGKTTAKNIIIEAKSSDESALISKTSSIIKIESLNADASQKIDLKFLTRDNITSKNYPVEIIIKYSDDLGTNEEFSQFAGIFISGNTSNEDSSKGKPKLIIDKYSFEPQLVKAGENFQMTLSFYNTSSTKTVKNIKIFLTAEAGGTNENSSSAFTPVDSSNTFYIDSISPKGKVEKTITMFTIPDAIAKTHTITANFEYEDNEGNPLEDRELIGVPVVQQSKLDTTELNYFPDTFIGQQTPISLEFYNTGKVPLYNLMVKLEGNFQVEGGSYYVGNFSSGSSDYFEGYVMPFEPGTTTGAVVFSYEDSTGQPQEIRKEFTLNVGEMPPMEEFPIEGMPGEEFPIEEGPTGIKGLLKSPWLWAGIIAIVAIVGFVIYKKKKKIKEEAFDE